MRPGDVVFMEPVGGAIAGSARFRVRGALGAGGMGEVLEVDDHVRGEVVALKVMRAEHAGPAALLRFKQEFRIVAELRHPHLVRLHDLFCDAGEWFFTMERVRGTDLAAAVRWEDRSEEPSGEAETAPIGAGVAAGEVRLAAGAPAPACDVAQLLALLPQVLDALEALHARGIAHRDLKPANVLVTDDGVVKLADFGIACAIEEDLGASGLLGTAVYMSPEQAAGREIGLASDVYSLGVMLYELLAGEPPFRGRALELLEAHRARAPRPLAEVIGGLPDALAAVCTRMLAKDPRARPTLAEIRGAVDVAQPARAADSPDDRPEVFVGRARELEALEAALGRGGDGPWVGLIRGRSGEGKTALLEQLCLRAAASGRRVLRGRCYEREAVPFLAFDRLMDQLALRLRSWPIPFRRSIAPELFEAARLFPVIAVAVPRGVRATRARSEDAAQDPHESRRRAILAVIELVRRATELEPLLFAIDDLQWVDAESLELLDALLAARPLPLAIACAARVEDLSPAHPFERWLRERSRDGEVMVLELPPLGAHEVAELVAHKTGGAPVDAAAIERLHEQTGGHALLVATQAERWARGGGAAPETSLATLLAERMAELSPDGRALASLAAAAGGASSARLLGRASSIGPERVQLALDELTDRGVLRRARRDTTGRDGLDPGFDFRHDKLREAAYDGLDHDARVETHRALGAVLEDERFADWPGRLEALARHFEIAEDLPRTRRYLELAAEDAGRKLAFGRASALWERRIAHTDEPADRARAWTRIAELRDYLGDYAGGAEAHARAAQEHSREGDRPAELRARLREGNVLVRIGRLEEGTAAFERALRPMGMRLERSTTARLLVLAGLWLRWALARAWGRRRAPEDGERLATEAVWLVLQAFMLPQGLAAAEFVMRGRVLGERTTGAMAEILGGLADVMVAAPRRVSPGRARAIRLGLERIERHAEEAQRAGLLGADVLPALFAAFAAAAGEDWDPALAALESALARHRATPNLWAARTAQSLLAVLGSFAGREAEAEEHARELFALGARDVGLAACGAWVLAAGHCRRGELAELERLVSAWEPLVPERPVNRLALWRDMVQVVALLLRGALREAIDLHERRAPIYRRAGHFVDVSNESGWAYAPLHAAVRLAREGQLTGRDRRRYLRWARRLSRRATLHFRSVFHAVEAELLDAAGRDGSRALDEALARSARWPMPFERWLCLRSACRLGRSDAALDAERAALEAKHRFRYDGT